MSEKSGRGQPSPFTPELKDKILRMAELGLTDKQVGYICGVTERTVNNWKASDPDFFHALKVSKEVADMEIEKSLYMKAKGGLKTIEKHEGVDANGNIIDKTVEKELAPDNTSMIFWLKNRQPDKWRDKRENEISTKDDKPLTLAYKVE